MNLQFSCLTQRRPTPFSTTASPKSYSCPTASAGNKSLQLSLCQECPLAHSFPKIFLLPIPQLHVSHPSLKPSFQGKQALQTFQLPGLSDFHKARLKHLELISSDNPSVASKNCGEQSELLPSVCFKIISAIEMYLYSEFVCCGRWTQSSDFPEQSAGSLINSMDLF